MTHFIPVETNLDLYMDEGLGVFGSCEFGDVWYDKVGTCRITLGDTLIIENVEKYPITLVDRVHNYLTAL